MKTSWNYLTWTANFGVVPLFRFCALRLAPALRCLALRRASVTAVLDAMGCSSREWVKLSLMVLAFLLGDVKDLCAAPIEDLILAKGEQREVQASKLKHFSVGNKEVVATRVLGEKILIKGRQTGFSDLIVWDSNGRWSRHVYVLSKNAFLKTIQLAETLKDLDLTLDLKGPLMVVRGKVTAIETWRYLLHLRKLHHEKVVFQVEASPDLRRFMAEDVYRDLFASGFTRVACRMRFLDMECSWEGGQKTSAGEEVMTALTSRWGVKFMARESRWALSNLRIKMKLLQIERTDGQELSFGLATLKARPQDLFSNGLQKLVEDNQILLGESHVRMSTLAEPEALIRLGKANLVEVGAQIPYQNISQGQGMVIAPIDWRFAGLRVLSTLEEKGGQLTLDYEAEFTRPVQNGISGSKEKGSLLVQPGIAYKIFEIGYQADGLERHHWPGLENVPILQTLFGSRSKQRVHKRIEGYLVIEAEP